MTEQERLNYDIATEIENWQTHLEYGRVMLGASDEVRKKYKWLPDLKSGGWIVLFVDLLSAIIGVVQEISILLWSALVILLIIVIYYGWRFSIRKDFAVRLDKKEYKKISNSLKEINAYISQLIKWLEDTDVNTQIPLSSVRQIKESFIAEKAKMKGKEDELSNHFGKLNDEWLARARKFSSERIIQYRRFTKKQNNHE